MNRFLTSLIAGLVLVLLTAVPARAQDSELAGGFANATWNGCCARGFAIDFSRELKAGGARRKLAIVVDFAQTTFKGDERDTSIVGGVRLKLWGAAKIEPFVQGTAGVVRWKEICEECGATGTEFIVGGGGVVVKINDRLAAKAQFDIWAQPEAADHVDRLTRLYLALVYRWSKK